MEWFIKKNSTLPIFQVEVSQNGRSDFNRVENLSGNTYVISVYDSETNKYIVTSKPCYLTHSASTVNPEDIITYINYQFTNREVSKHGRYLVQISETGDNGVIVLPLKEKIFVNVIESFSLDNYSFDNNYIVDRPCCNP
jgi:hypothetical protein